MITRIARIGILLLLSPSVLLAADGPENRTSQGLLTLRNGSQAHGRLTTLNSDAALSWQVEGFAQPFEFVTTGISSIHFPPPVPPVPLQGEFSVELHNGDLLAGKIVSWSPEVFTLETRLLGLFSIHTSAIQQINRLDKDSTLLLSGLSGLQSWQTVTGEWQDKGASLLTEQPGASLISDFQLPPQARVEFELSWKKAPNFVFSLGIDPQQPETAQADWTIEAWGSQLVLVGEREDVAAVTELLPLKSGTNSLHLVAYLDQSRQTIQLYTPAGQPLKTITLPPSDKPQPQADPFVSASGISLLNHEGDIQLSQLRIAKWNGRLPVQQGEGANRFTLTDDSDAEGTFVGFEQELQTISLQKDEQTTAIPLQQVVSAQLAAKKAVLSQPLLVTLQDHTRISGTLARVDQEHLVLTSTEMTGEISLPRRSLYSLVCTAPAPTENSPPEGNRLGRLVLGSADSQQNTLRGVLVPGKVTEKASCLNWQPEYSRTSSPLIRSAAGIIVYKEARKPVPQVQQSTIMEAAPPQNAFQQFGNLFLKNLEKPRRQKKAAATTDPHVIHLITGDVVPCRVISINEEGVHIASQITQAQQISHANIKAVVLDPSAKQPELEKVKQTRLLTLPRNQKASPPQHLLCATSGDFLRCRINSLNEREFLLELQLSEVTVPRDRVSHIIWLHPETLVLTEEQKEQAASQKSETPPASAQTDGLHLTQVLLPNGNRTTFQPQQVEDGQLIGISDIVGESRYRLSDVDQIIFGDQIQSATRDLPFQEWVLQPAIEPLYTQATAEGSPQAGLVSQLVGKPAPDFKLDMLDGSSFTLSKARGKIIVLDFWATWCGPCMLTMPLLEEAMQEFDTDKVQLISVNLEERNEQIKEVLERQKWQLSVALDRDGVVARRYQIDSIPQLIVVDAEGNVARHYVGGGQNIINEFKAALSEMLSSAPQ